MEVDFSEKGWPNEGVPPAHLVVQDACLYGKHAALDEETDFAFDFIGNEQLIA